MCISSVAGQFVAQFNSLLILSGTHQDTLLFTLQMLCVPEHLLMWCEWSVHLLSNHPRWMLMPSLNRALNNLLFILSRSTQLWSLNVFEQAHLSYLNCYREAYPNSATLSSLCSRSPPRPSPGGLHYSDEDVSAKCNDLIPAENSSLTEKPSEVSDSQVSQSFEIRSTCVHIYTPFLNFFFKFQSWFVANGFPQVLQVFLFFSWERTLSF